MNIMHLYIAVFYCTLLLVLPVVTICLQAGTYLWPNAPRWPYTLVHMYYCTQTILLHTIILGFACLTLLVITCVH